MTTGQGKMSDREVERGSGVAVWRQIGEALAEDIRNKLYGPGEQLPPEPELASRFAVNRHTIRRAMGELELSGLVRIEQGRGTFVQEHAIDYAIGRRTRFSQNLAAQGMRGHTELVDSQILRAPEIAKHLGLSRTAEILHVQMLGKAEGRTIDVAEHYFDPKRFPGFEDKVSETIDLARAGEVRHCRLHPQVVAHHGGHAERPGGAIAESAEDASYPASGGTEHRYRRRPRPIQHDALCRRLGATYGLRSGLK
jgi:GntR family phosphonate transport system transcriptional regulator